MALLRTPAARLLLSGALLLSLVPLASAQAPPVSTSAVIDFAVICQSTFAQVDYRGSTQLNCELQDLTRDGPFAPGAVAVGSTGHTTTLQVTPQRAHGWQVTLSRQYFVTYNGGVEPFFVTVQNTPQIDQQRFDFDLLANFTGPDGKTLNQTVHMTGQVSQYDIAHVTSVVSQIEHVGQAQIATYKYQITNDGVFPDEYAITVAGPSDFAVSQPGNIYVPPHETRNVSFSVLTPHGKLYELGESAVFSVKFVSTRGTGVYPYSALIHVEGWYVPTYWIPLTLVGLVAAVIVTRRARGSFDERRLEGGRPRRVAVTPRQAVLLAELKRSDPAAFKERKAQLDSIYAARRDRYRGERKAQLAKDRAERAVAKREFAEAKKRRRAEKRALKVQHNEEKKAAKRQRKVDKKAAKVDAKEAGKKEKVLGKKRRELEKARTKQAAVDAKQAARDAKAQAKADAAARKQAKADAKAAKKAQKAAEKDPRPPSGGQ